MRPAARRRVTEEVRSTGSFFIWNVLVFDPFKVCAGFRSGSRRCKRRRQLFFEG
jgi:hypothetical protein